MMFAFTRKEATQSTIWMEADTELEAWQRVIDGDLPDNASDRSLLREPVFKRLPEQDEQKMEYDL